ncbi:MULTISPECIES: FCD domain-containing protein [unclassified Brevibacterium]|uniref:FCD domain-containing protein n=1 Tax=unclassified Brevibacterium TaxID=2614124 RepID=UPI0010817CC5|nr:FCD domain-containing protein [Brevibacterium sp. S111]TGD13742.1 GntR family transcriptional regulator [Brevibacterium sp. S111]
MYSPEFRRQAVAALETSTLAEVALATGASPTSLRRWASRSDLSDRPRSGRPPIQDTADRVVEALVATAGARISGRDYSTRALAEATGLSQSIVSRSVRSLTVPVATVTGGHEIILAASGFPLVIVGVRRVDAGDEGENGGGGPSVPPRRIQRRIAGIAAALRSAGVGRWRQRFDSEHRQMPTGQLLDLLSGEGRFLVFDPLREVPDDLGAGPESRVSACVDFEEFLDALKAMLAGCQDIPGSLLDLLSARVRHGLEGVLWRESVPVEPVRSSMSSDSMEISSWLPKETRSITEHLAIALREEIIDSGYEPGDRINPRLLSRRMRVPRASVDAALRRMVDDKLLDGSRGGARIPLITTVDVLDLYAARMAIGEVVLRSLSLRPQRYLVPVQLALRQVEASAPTRSGIDVEDADLHFQQELARASGLRESARAFESLTLRLRLFISVLQLDYSPASDRIVSDDRAMFRALSGADAKTAIDVWRGKVDNAVRHMAGLLGRRRFDQQLWTQLTRSLG